MGLKEKDGINKETSIVFYRFFQGVVREIWMREYKIRLFVEVMFVCLERSLVEMVL